MTNRFTNHPSVLAFAKDEIKKCKINTRHLCAAHFSSEAQSNV